MGELYLYRAPLDWLAQRLVAATAHPIRSRRPDQPPGLTPQRVTLRWAPAAGGAIRTQRGLLWTSHESPLTLSSYQHSGPEAFIQFRPARRPAGEGRPLQDRFHLPGEGPVTASASLQNDRLTIRGRHGQTPFLRQIATPGLLPGRWSVRATSDRGQVRLTLGPPDRPPLGARILAFRGQIEQPTAQPLVTGHVSIAAILAMEVEWLDNQGHRRITDWQIPVRHLLPLPDASPNELLGIDLQIEELRWAQDRPVWALLGARIARYRPTFLPVGMGAGEALAGLMPTPIMVGYTETSFAWTESSQSSPSAGTEGSSPPTQHHPLEIPFDRPISRLLALDLRPGALDLLIGLKGGGLHLLTTSSPWTSPPQALTVLALAGRVRLQR